ncbi:unnamed protein product, partial [Strongylus vulgaris]
LGPEQRGVEQSITIIISFHSTFITKVDRAYRCTCFYMEADKVVTSRFDVSMLPTTDLIDTARMPLCTYTVRRDSITGPIVQYAQVGDLVYHVWQCESDMFSMLVHSCFVDDSNGQDRKPFLDEHGCAIDPVIVPDLTYNKENNLAFAQVNVFKFADKITTYFQCAVSTCMISEGMCDGKTVNFEIYPLNKAFIQICAIDPVIVPDLTYNKENNLAFAQVNVFKFADKITTYFQCAVSTCMISEGMCDGKTPPRCGPLSQPQQQHFRLVRSASELRNSTRSSWVHLDNTMDLSAQKITVLDLEENSSDEVDSSSPARLRLGSAMTHGDSSSPARLRLGSAMTHGISTDSVCVSSRTAAILTTLGTGSTLIAAIITFFSIMRYRKVFDKAQIR